MLPHPTTLQLALLSAAVLGFKHGFDYDHIAAISDITSVEPSRGKGMRMGLVYVIGHASTVAVLDGAVILFQRSLPARVDNWVNARSDSRWCFWAYMYLEPCCGKARLSCRDPARPF